MSKVYENTVGLPIVVDLGVSLAGAVSPTIELIGPNGRDSWSATVHESTKLRYVTQADDLPAGTYHLQGKPNLPDLDGALSETVTFTVYKRGH